MKTPIGEASERNGKHLQKHPTAMIQLLGDRVNSVSLGETFKMRRERGFKFQLIVSNSNQVSSRIVVCVNSEPVVSAARGGWH